jgi:hypothetical protein
MLSEKIMLADRLFNLPHAIHSFGKGDKIAFADLHMLAICRRDNNAAFEEIADFSSIMIIQLCSQDRTLTAGSYRMRPDFVAFHQIFLVRKQSK